MTATQNGHAEGGMVEDSGRGPEGDRKFVTALARGLAVLRCFRAHDGFLTNQEIAERTGLPRPTITRITYTLCELGYLKQTPRLGKYQLAPGIITLGYAAFANHGIRHAAREFMDEAAEALSAPIGLGVLDRDKALYLDTSRGFTTFTVQLDIGSRIPLAETAMGLALLVTLPEQEREIHIKRSADRDPGKWPVLRRTMDRALSDYEKYGFVVATGEWRSDVFSAGAALVAEDGSGTYAFNCGAPPYHFSPERLYNEVGPVMASLVRVVEDALNGRRPLRPDRNWLPAPQSGGLPGHRLENGGR